MLKALIVVFKFVLCSKRIRRTWMTNGTCLAAADDSSDGAGNV